MKRHYYSFLRKMAMTLAGVAFACGSVSAVTFTALASGDFSNSLTWGGTAPTNLVIGDMIVIPSGITVTLDNDVTIGLGSSLDVDGTLTSGTNATALVMTAGTLSGNGSIDVDSMALGLVTGFTYTGMITANEMTSLATTINTAANVTVNNMLYVTAGLLNITDGSFTLGNNSTIVIDGGTIAVGGTGTIGLTNNYNVVYEGSSSTAGIELTGSGLEDVTINLSSSSSSVTLSDDLSVSGDLNLMSGNLDLDGNDLTLGTNSDLMLATGAMISSNSGSNITINSMNSLSSDLMLDASNNSVNNLTINLGSSSANVDLGSDININGTLTLTQGTLTLNNNDLTFSGNGDVALSGSGMLVSTSGSDIMINSTNGFTGSLNFATTGNTVGDLTINLGTNTDNVNLGTDLNVAGTLTLTSGSIDVEDNDLMINAGGSISGGSQNSFVITSNGGTLSTALAAGASFTYHVGYEAGTTMHYAPMMLTGNTGSVTSDVSVMVDENVWSQGTTGVDLTTDRSLVDATWYVTSTATTGIDLDMEVMWSADMEVNGFDRTNAYISHYMGGNWDVMATSAATASGSMYAMTRSNVTSLSPFTVADNNSALAVNKIAKNAVDINVFPNPATDVINFTSPSKVNTINIYDLTGRAVKSIPATNNSIPVSDLAPGMYNVQFNGADFQSNIQFIKK